MSVGTAAVGHGASIAGRLRERNSFSRLCVSAMSRNSSRAAVTPRISQATGNGQSLRRGSDIAERLLELGAAALLLAARLPRSHAGRHIAMQLVRCATSAGANYEEARAAESRDDFAHKASIAAKEMRETAYWLALIERCGWPVPEALLGEANELAAILGASARTARAEAPKPSRRAGPREPRDAPLCGRSTRPDHCLLPVACPLAPVERRATPPFANDGFLFPGS